MVRLGQPHVPFLDRSRPARDPQSRSPSRRASRQTQSRSVSANQAVRRVGCAFIYTHDPGFRTSTCTSSKQSSALLSRQMAWFQGLRDGCPVGRPRSLCSYKCLCLAPVARPGLWPLLPRPLPPQTRTTFLFSSYLSFSPNTSSSSVFFHYPKTFLCHCQLPSFYIRLVQTTSTTHCQRLPFPETSHKTSLFPSSSRDTHQPPPIAQQKILQARSTTTANPTETPRDTL